MGQSNKPSDIFSPAKRSEIMSKVKSKNTKPERIVRTTLHKMGFRFRLHRDDLPGKPDIVMPKYEVVILVHGCFWHQHDGCKKSTIPKSNSDFWQNKLERNRRRDEENIVALKELGWHVLVIWECQTHDTKYIEQCITDFIEVRNH